MSNADDAPEGPTLDDLRARLAALSAELCELSGSGLGKVTAQMRDRPLAAIRIALGVGVLGGYLLNWQREGWASRRMRGRSA